MTKDAKADMPLPVFTSHPITLICSPVPLRRSQFAQPFPTPFPLPALSLNARLSMATTASQPVTSNARANTATDHTTRKGKVKKAADPAHTSKQIEDTIAQLERNRAGDKEQEIEIGTFTLRCISSKELAEPYVA